jgi:signal transduction histidine kinase
VYPAYPGDQERPSRPPRPPLTKRLRPVHWIALDCVVAAVATILVTAIAREPVATQVAPAFGPPPAGVSEHAAFPVVLLLAPGIFVPIALRRRAPVLAFGVLVISAAILIGAGEDVRALLFFLGAAYVLYTVTVTSSRRTGAAALALGVGVIAIIVTGAKQAVYSGMLIPAALAMVIAWIIGYSVRQRRLYILTLQHQAASSAVAEERLRIARELHDVVAHSMAVIAVQAGYGQYVIDASPQGAREALDAIQATSRDALDEMRRMLGVLRQQDSGQQDSGQQDSPAVSGLTGAALAAMPAPGQASAASGSAEGLGAGAVGDPRGAGTAAFDRGTDTAGIGPGTDTAAFGPGTDTAAFDRVASRTGAPLAPAPGLADLGRLIERTGGAGITVSLEISGVARPVPASVDLSGFRIIQEALTNVVKHAGGGTACAVVVRYTDAELVIRVTDDGGEDLVLSPAGLAPKAPPVAGGGHGIIGMRERAALCGGQFQAGPRHDGGWQVSAVLPLRTPGTDAA